MVSRHQSVRECWLEKEKGMEAKLADLGNEKKELTSEVTTLADQLKETETKLLQRVHLNNDQQVKVKSFVCFLFLLLYLLLLMLKFYYRCHCCWYCY